jgi:hypothetical protein
MPPPAQWKSWASPFQRMTSHDTRFQDKMWFLIITLLTACADNPSPFVDNSILNRESDTVSINDFALNTDQEALTDTDTLGTDTDTPQEALTDTETLGTDTDTPKEALTDTETLGTDTDTPQEAFTDTETLGTDTDTPQEAFTDTEILGTDMDTPQEALTDTEILGTDTDTPQEALTDTEQLTPICWDHGAAQNCAGYCVPHRVSVCGVDDLDPGMRGIDWGLCDDNFCADKECWEVFDEVGFSCIIEV